MRRIIVDAGPLVAYFTRTDQWHDWARAQFASLPPPLISCEAVLAEVSFLVHRNGGDPSCVLRLVHEKILSIPFQIESEARALETLMKRYADLPMSLADASLVRLSEIYADCKVLTLDGHFQRYRRHGRQVIPLVTPI